MGRTDTDHVRSRLGSVHAARPAEADAVAEADSDDSAFSPEWLTEQDSRATSALSRFLPARWRSARMDPGPGGALAIAGVGAAMVAIAAVSVFHSRPSAAPVPPLPVVQMATQTAASASSPSSPLVAAQDLPIVVSVVGMVPISGLLTLPAGSRIADALDAAGGPQPGADVLDLNLAQKLVDGDQIIVGAAPASAQPADVSVTVGSSATGGAPAAASPGASAASKVNLNTATLDELDSLPGVGPVTAAAIISWRETNGKFVNADQLGEVAGIGPARLEKLRTEVAV